jgi:hypothetical protein
MKIILYNTRILQLNKVKSNEITYKDNEGTTLIKHGSWIDSTSLY